MQTRLYLYKIIFCPQAEGSERRAPAGQQRAAPSPAPARPRRSGYLRPGGLREAASRCSSSQPGELEREARESGEPWEGLRGRSPSAGGGLGSAVPAPLIARGSSGGGGQQARQGRSPPALRPCAPGPAPPRFRRGAEAVPANGHREKPGSEPAAPDDSLGNSLRPPQHTGNDGDTPAQERLQVRECLPGPRHLQGDQTHVALYLFFLPQRFCTLPVQ